jgi:hypothetical protein
MRPIDFAGAWMRYIIANWPDFFLIALALAGTCVVMCLPLNIWLRLALVPVAFAVAFAVWGAMVFLITWLLWPR